jgi:post-segregation antitoxin (ccd killing protein)
MSQLAQERIHLGALVDREQRDRLAALARQQDCSVSRLVRQAIDAELKRQGALAQAAETRAMVGSWRKLDLSEGEN